MRNGLGRIVSACAVTLVGVTAARGTTWAPVKVTCPLCQTANTFQTIMSYGSYIYGWPSKYQFVFWPYTDSNVVYCCRQCGLCSFMGDFTKVPKEKAEDVKKALVGLTFEFADGQYNRAAMSRRLAAAEKVYTVLGRDEYFWCHFYRVLGYHFEGEAEGQEGETKQRSLAQAKEARRKAVARLEALLRDEGNAPVRKELLLVRGAMRHFLADDQGALTDFEGAAKLTYRGRNSQLEELEKKDLGKLEPAEAERVKRERQELQRELKETAQGKDQYLSDLLEDYIGRLRKRSDSTRPASRPAVPKSA